MKRSIVTLVVVFSLAVPFSSFGQASKPPPKKSPELLNQGKKLYEQYCLTCHGATGDGKGPVGTALKPPPRDFNLPLSQWPHAKGDIRKVFEVISKGIPNTSMVKWDHLSEQERWAMTYYVVEFAKPKTPVKKK
ncbi:MAG: cytochrome c [Desulfobacterota bacterium]|nr:cytochrome c [Thermodesulfobacteriota bacterium]